MRITTALQVARMFARLTGRVPVGHLWYLFRRMANERPHRFNGQTRINTFFPPYPSPAFDRFCAAVIARRRVPFSVYLAVTGACPFHCPHCSYAGRADGRMSREQLLGAVGQIKSLGTCTLGFTGGEPMLCDELEDLVTAAGPEMATIVFTTGHGLDAARARRLASAGVSCVTVGIESADAEAHDRVRGRAGSFAEAEAAVRACQDMGIYTAISTVGTRERIAGGELTAMYELGRRWGVGEFRLLAPVATGRLRGCAAAMLEPQERRALFDFHVEHNRRGDGPAVNSFAYLESDELFGCGAGYHHLYIDAAGQVCPCDLTPLSFGDVTAEPLADIWQRMERFFPLPRRGCLMGALADRLDSGASLPLPQEQSESLCAGCGSTTLPEGYRRLLTAGRCGGGLGESGIQDHHERQRGAP